MEEGATELRKAGLFISRGWNSGEKLTKSLHRIKVIDSRRGAPKDVIHGLIWRRAECMGAQESVRI